MEIEMEINNQDLLYHLRLLQAAFDQQLFDVEVDLTPKESECIQESLF